MVGGNKGVRASQGDDMSQNVSSPKRVPMPHPLLESNYFGIVCK